MPACPAPKAVVLAFGAQHEAVESARRADGGEAVSTAGEQFVHIGLVANVEEEVIRWRLKDVVHGDGQLDHAEVRAEMSAGARQRVDQLAANLCCKLGQARPATNA